MAGRPIQNLYREHADNVLRAAFRVVGNQLDAEDVLQTVFLRLLRRRPPAGVDWGAYLRRAAVHAGVDVLRTRKRRPNQPLDSVAVEPPATDAGPERLHAGRQLGEALRAALALERPRAAELFLLRYVEGFDNGEIAGLVGMSRGAVAVTLHRVRSRLKERLEIAS